MRIMFALDLPCSIDLSDVPVTVRQPYESAKLRKKTAGYVPDEFGFQYYFHSKVPHLCTILASEEPLPSDFSRSCSDLWFTTVSQGIILTLKECTDIDTHTTDSERHVFGERLAHYCAQPLISTALCVNMALYNQVSDVPLGFHLGQQYTREDFLPYARVLRAVLGDYGRLDHDGMLEWVGLTYGRIAVMICEEIKSVLKEWGFSMAWHNVIEMDFGYIAWDPEQCRPRSRYILKARDVTKNRFADRRLVPRLDAKIITYRWFEGNYTHPFDKPVFPRIDLTGYWPEGRDTRITKPQYMSRGALMPSELSEVETDPAMRDFYCVPPPWIDIINGFIDDEKDEAIVESMVMTEDEEEEKARLINGRDHSVGTEEEIGWQEEEIDVKEGDESTGCKEEDVVVEEGEIIR